MSFVSSSARTVMVNDDNNANYSNSDNTAEANNDNTIITNGSATSPVVLRLASGNNDSRRRRAGGRSPTAAAGVSLRSGGGIRRGILKRPRASHTTTSEAPYVPAPVPEIIANMVGFPDAGHWFMSDSVTVRRSRYYSVCETASHCAYQWRLPLTVPTSGAPLRPLLALGRLSRGGPVWSLRVSATGSDSEPALAAATLTRTRSA